MTETDWARFSDVFAALCRAFAKPVNDETDTLANEYFEALEDYPIALVERGKLALVRGSKFFPRVRDWRQTCDTIRGAERPSAVTTIAHADGEIEPLFCCLACHDSGWRPACGCRLGDLDWRGECPQDARTVHGRTYRQAMTACACRESNPAFQAHRPRVGRA